MNDRTGRKIGSYCLVRLLGRGNFSEVYLGEHMQRKTQAAIKIFRTQLPACDQKQFLAEVKVLQALEHPHIVRILEAGVEGDAPFLAMTYASNGSMSQYYPAGIHFPPQRVLSYIREVTSALQYLHDHQLIHHNIRPENLLLDEKLGILLSDCSLASIAKSSRSQDMQEITSSIAYMAPEQLKGQPCPASDQYALGITAYEWLSGEVPFHGTFREIALQQVFMPSPPLHEKVPEIMSSVEEVIQIALAKEPNWRFGSVRAFAHALEHACSSGQPALELRTFFRPNSSPDVVNKLDKRLAPVDVEPVTQEFLDPGTPSSLSLPLASAVQNAPGRSRPLTKKAILLVILAFFVVMSCAGLIYASVLRPAQLRTQVAPTSRSNALVATQTAQAYSNEEATTQAQALPEATATAAAENNLYIHAIRGVPVINDALRNNSGNSWSDGTSSKGESCLFTGGAYHAVEPQPGGIYPCFDNASNFQNFAFQVQMTILKGDAGGLVFEANKTHTEYGFFQLLSDGTYRYGYSGVSGGIGFFGYLLYPSPIVGQISPQSNLLTVIVRNGEAFMYVNARYVVSMAGDSAAGGEVGVFAHDNTLSTDVAFSNARVWQL
jgi:serine/threonine protein kinase